jgi:hypothetical protein
MDSTSVYVPIILIGSMLISIPLIYRFLRRHHERMRRVADELGFSYNGPGAEAPGTLDTASPGQRFLQALKPWRITGMRDDVAVAIYLETRGGGKSSTTYSIVEASFPRPLPFKLRIGRETVLARLGKGVFGLHDIEVGVEQFDAAARVKGSDPDRIRDLLSGTGVQDRIVTALEASPTLTITEKAALWEKRGTGEAAETYRLAMDLVVPIVRALKDAGAFPEH